MPCYRQPHIRDCYPEGARPDLAAAQAERQAVSDRQRWAAACKRYGIVGGVLPKGPLEKVRHASRRGERGGP